MKLSINPAVFSLLTRVNTILTKRKVKAYLVGGAVRDAALGRDTADIDIAVAADALAEAKTLADSLNGNYVLLDEENGIARVVPGGEVPAIHCYLDVSTMRGDIEADLARRDFTVNAMALDLAQLVDNAGEATLLDPYQGQRDVKKKTIRTVSEEALQNDAARLLRAVRLAAELGFTIAKSTEAQIILYSTLIGGVAGERVREEFLRILAVRGAGRFVRELDRLGLLTALIPELSQSRGVEQPKEHVWDVFNHSLETVSAVEFVLGISRWEHADGRLLEAIPQSDKIDSYFAEEISCGSARSTLLKLAALLHDVAKPQTKTFEANGRMRFFGHGDEGARIAVEVMERLRFSNREIKQVELMVKYHLRPVQLSESGAPTNRAIYRFFRDTGDAGIGAIFLSLADHLAARGPTLDRDEWQRHSAEMGYVLSHHFQKQVEPPPRLLDGHEIMAAFGIKPGPALGRILDEVTEAQSAGELTTKEQALAYIKENLVLSGES